MAAIDRLLEAALKNQVELVMLEPGRLPRFRRGGADHEVTQSPLDGAAIERLLAEVAPPGGLPPAHPGARFSFDHEIAGARFHFACLAGPAGWTASATPAAAAPPGAAALDPAEKARRPLPPAEILLRSMVELGASDLHLAAWQAPRLRIHGELATLDLFEAPTSARLKELLYEITPERERALFEATARARFAFEIPDFARFRVELLRDRQGVGAAVRHVPWRAPSADELELPTLVRQLAAAPRGLVLLAGPSGSGRSTTLAALVGLAAERRPAHLVTIERPIEYALESARSLIRQIEVPTRAATAREAVESTRLLDVDVVALADGVEPAALAAAIARAEAGALVFAVVDAAGVAGAVERALDALAPESGPRAAPRLAAALAGVVAQKLVRRAGGGRRAAVWELAPAAPGLVAAIADDELWRLPAALAAAHGAGARSEVEALADLVAFQVVDAADAAAVAADRAALAERLRALESSGALAARVEAGR